MMMNIIPGLVALLLVSGTAFGADSPLRPDHPERYVVKEGDTLWGVASRFLQEPWRWPEVWRANESVQNPNLIYPGDVLVLRATDRVASVQLQQRGRPTVKLSPRARATPLQVAIPTVPITAIRQFLSRPRVLEDDALLQAPYVVTVAGENVVGGAGDRVYARGIEDAATRTFTVLRAGQVYVDPDTQEQLGFEALYLGDARVQQHGDPATLELLASVQEITAGDRLLPAVEDDFQDSYLPQGPSFAVEGKIIAVLNGVSQIGQFNVVVVNRGAREGIVPGHVLAVYQSGEVIPDPVAAERRAFVRLPDERAGVLMVFRTFEKLSYGLIMSATRAIHVLDVVGNL